MWGQAMVIKTGLFSQVSYFRETGSTMRRPKRCTAQEACELTLNHVVEKNDQDDNVEHHEEEESTEDSVSEDEENKDEVIDTFRPHATSNEEAPHHPLKL